MSRHPLDPVSLIFGGLLAGLGGFLVASNARWETANGAWVLPAVLMLLGGAILWSTLMRLVATGTPAENDALERTPERDDEHPVPGIPDLD